MTFQAYKMLHPCGGIYSQNQIYLVCRFPSLCVPASPVRSSFSAAFADVKSLRKSGLIASVRLINSTNQL